MFAIVLTAQGFINLPNHEVIVSNLPPRKPVTLPNFDQRLNGEIDELGKGYSWLGIRAFCREHRYVLSFVLLFIVTVGTWIGFRHQQEQRLGVLEDVLELHEKYVGKMEPSTSQTGHSMSVRQEPQPWINPERKAENPPAQEQAIPDEDKAVIEDLDLFEDYDFLRKFEFVDVQTKFPSK